MKRYLILAVLAIGIFSAGIRAQQLTPSKSQYARLAKKRQKVISTQSEMAKLQAQQAFELGDFQEEARKIIVENRWPTDTTIDFTTGAFFRQQPAPPPLTNLPNPAPPAKDAPKPTP